MVTVKKKIYQEHPSATAPPRRRLPAESLCKRRSKAPTPLYEYSNTFGSWQSRLSSMLCLIRATLAGADEYVASLCRREYGTIFAIV